MRQSWWLVWHQRKKAWNQITITPPNILVYWINILSLNILKSSQIKFIIPNKLKSKIDHIRSIKRPLKPHVFGTSRPLHLPSCRVLQYFLCIIVSQSVWMMESPPALFRSLRDFCLVGDRNKSESRRADEAWRRRTKNFIASKAAAAADNPPHAVARRSKERKKVPEAFVGVYYVEPFVRPSAWRLSSPCVSFIYARERNESGHLRFKWNARKNKCLNVALHIYMLIIYTHLQRTFNSTFIVIKFY